MLRPAQGQTFNLAKFYRIWISPSPNEFLDLENVLRFIRLRSQHPKAQIAFIYSSRCLNAKALSDLQLFCKQHRLISIDFDSQLPAQLKTKNDLALYACAKDEIDNTRANQNGNLAAASDCIRIMRAVIEEWGIYSDHDVSFNFSPLISQATFLQLKAPVLLSVCFMPTPNPNTKLISANSDFLAFATDIDSNKLTSEALKALENLQARAISNYESPMSLNKLTSADDVSLANSAVKQIYAAITQGKNFKTIFEFRRICAEFFTNNTKYSKLTQKNFMTSTVTCMAGPNIYNYLYQHLSPIQPYAGQAIQNKPEWEHYLTAYQKSDAYYYGKIQECIVLNNRLDVILFGRKPGGDSSWTPDGAKSKRERINKMTAAGHTLLFALQGRKAAQASLLLQAKPICSPLHYKLLSEKNYSLVFRQACNDLNLPLVALLLHFKQRITLKLDQCSSNGKNALDWALSSAQKNESNREKIVALLKQAGIKPSNTTSAIQKAQCTG